MQQPSKKLLSDDPRGLRDYLFLRWFSVFDALPVTPALLVLLLFARRFGPVLLPSPPTEHVRAALRQPSLQYRCRACRGRNRRSHPFNRHRQVRGRRDGRFRPWAACLSPCLVGFSLGPMGGLAPRSSGPGGECHSSPGHRYPVPWKLNTVSKLCLLYLVPEKRWRPASPSPGCSFSCHGGRLWSPLIPLKSTWFLALGAAYSGDTYFRAE